MKFAFDRSLRTTDADGRLHVECSRISKATVNPYYGSEIPGFDTLGLAADKVYKLLRDPVELERAAPTFARLPILSKHVPVTVDAPRPDLVVGAIGSDVTFNAPYLEADICVWDASAIAGIESDVVRELSCAYRYVPVMTPGEFEGQAYDGVMTEIRGNHLALVEVGRAGSDVVVADANPFKIKEPEMKMTKLGKALFAALCAASPVLAADSALPALVGNTTRKNFNKDELVKKLLALDEKLNTEQMAAAVDAIVDVEHEPKPMEPAQPVAKDESPADKLRKLLAGKVDDAMIEEACNLIATPAVDAELGVKPEEVKQAMDSLRKELREAEDARRDVRNVVGDVIGMDSASEVYGFALDHMKIDRVGVDSVAALRALFKVASSKSVLPTVRIAQDAGGLDKQFPAASRFRLA